MTMISDDASLLEYWSEKNQELSLDPNKISIGSGKYAYWNCSIGHTYKRVIRKQVKYSDCPVCKGLILEIGVNDVLTLYPELYEQAVICDRDSLRNFTKASTVVISWNCIDCDVVYSRRISSQIISKRKCDNCRVEGRVALKGQSISEAFPYLVPFWSSTNILKIEEVSYGCSDVFEWECKLGHIFTGQAYKLARKKRILCSICANIKTVAGVNDILTTHADIVSNWDYSLNTDSPVNFNFGSNKVVYWTCNFSHTFKRSITGHIKSKGRCPDCKLTPSGTSLLELDILDFLKSSYPNLDFIHRDRSSGFEIDIYIPELKVGIEVNGNYWHGEKISQKLFNLSSYERHLLKVNKAKGKGINLVFVWETDWNKKKDRVIEALSDLILNSENSVILNKLSFDDN